MNYDFEDLIDYEFGLIRLIIEFLFGSVIKLNGNTEALNFRLVCRKFKEEIDRLAHISVILPIKKRKKRRNYRLPSGVSSISVITKYSLYKIKERDWKDVFGNELNNLESSLKHLHVNVNLIEYLPNFNYLNSISWKVGSGICYELLDKIPHKELKVIGYNHPFHGSITRFTQLSEIEIEMDIFFNHRLIDKILPLTIRRMTIVMCIYGIYVLNLSKFNSLKYLKIVGHNYDDHLIEELILPPSLKELHSEVKIEKMNLHECKDLGVLELKFK
jgi:hypothetical protein